MKALLVTKNKHGIDGGHTVIATVHTGRVDRDLIIHEEQAPFHSPEYFARLFAASPVLAQALWDILQITTSANIRRIASEAMQAIEREIE